MKQAQFEQAYAAQWQTFADYLARLERASASWRRANVGLTADEYGRFAQLYRKVCHYHALARDRQYSSYLVDTLADLVARGHQQFYRRKYPLLRNIIAFSVADFPCLVRREQRYVWLASALLYLPALLMLLAVLWHPELVYTLLGPSQVQDFESMYNPANRVLGSGRDAGTDWQMFGFYINNNIGVAFRTFASGIFFGVGSIFFLVFNGLLFGAIAGHLTTVGYTQTFFSFVVGHGSFELTAITIAGAAGLKLGYGLLCPGDRTRLEALRESAAIAIRLIYGAALMLLAAAFVEAFWSSSGLVGHGQKFWVGGLLWLLVILYLVYGGRRRGSS